MMPIKKSDLENKTVALIHSESTIHEDLKPQEQRGIGTIKQMLMSPTKDTYIPIDRVQCARTRIEMNTNY